MAKSAIDGEAALWKQKCENVVIGHRITLRYELVDQGPYQLYAIVIGHHFHSHTLEEAFPCSSDSYSNTLVQSMSSLCST